MNHQALQANLLRLAGSTELLAFASVIMPRAWMEVAHEWLGLGEMPGGAVLIFLIRQASYVYGMHGVSLWLLATDVRRFRPLVIFNGVSFVLAAPIFFLIDYYSGMPLWWSVVDPLGCGFFGVALLLLDRRVNQQS